MDNNTLQKKIRELIQWRKDNALDIRIASLIFIVPACIILLSYLIIQAL